MEIFLWQSTNIFLSKKYSCNKEYVSQKLWFQTALNKTAVQTFRLRGAANQNHISLKGARQIAFLAKTLRHQQTN